MKSITFEGFTKVKFLQEAFSKQVICFGVGDHFKYVHNNLILPNNLNIKYLIDNSPEKQGQNLFGYNVFAPEKLLDEESNNILILITTLSPYDMNTQLEELGIFGAYASALFIEDFMGLTHRAIHLN